MIHKIVLNDWQWNRILRDLTDLGVDAETRDRLASRVSIRMRPKWNCLPVDTRLRSRVKALASEGYSQREIARKVNRSRSTVQYILAQQL